MKRYRIVCVFLSYRHTELCLFVFIIQTHRIVSVCLYYTNKQNYVCLSPSYNLTELCVFVFIIQTHINLVYSYLLLKHRKMCHTKRCIKQKLLCFNIIYTGAKKTQITTCVYTIYTDRPVMISFIRSELVFCINTWRYFL